MSKLSSNDSISRTRPVLPGLILFLLIGWIGVPAAAQAQAADTTTASIHPLLVKKKGRSTGERIARAPANIAEFPFELVGEGTERVMDFVEANRLIPRLRFFPLFLRKRHIVLGNGAQGDGSGLGGELGLIVGTNSLPGAEIKATGAYTNKAYQRHQIQLRFPGLLTPRGEFQTWFMYKDRAEDNFYGLSPSSSKTSRTRYREKSLGAGARALFQAGPMFLSPDFDWTTYDIEDGKTGFSTLTGFPNAPGLDGPTLTRFGFTVTYPRRPEMFFRGKAGEGGVLASLDVFSEVDGNTYGFNRYNMILYQTVPVFWDRILAFKLHSTISDARNGKATPFFLSPTLGGSSNLRGWETMRFRDKDMILFTAEYRYPLWNIGLPTGAAMEAVWFVDTGMVYNALEKDFSFGSLATDYGGGLRFRNNEGIMMRFNLAHSSESTIFSFKAGKEF